MRRTFGYHIVLLFIAIFFVNSVSFSQNATISGKVRYGNEVLQAATISLGDETTLADHTGKFSFSIKPGSYWVIITHAGYRRMEKFITVNAGETKNFDFEMIPIDQLDEVVLLGSRSTVQRSNLNTAVPVDVFSSDKLVLTGQLGLIQMLNYLVPSLTAGRQGANESVTLRGLNPDHILILINGIRYHNSAWLNNGTPKSNLGRGSVANDLSSIPFSAVEKVEVLRDGASAQYGSDAIAGVINIRLKESTGKTSIQLHTGQFYAGDGSKFFFGINRGIELNKKGFLNYSADFRYLGPTTRAGEYQGTVYKNYPQGSSSIDSAMIKAQDDSIIHASGINKKEFIRNNASNKIISSGLLVNAGYPVGNRLELFWTTSVNYRKNRQAGSYRYPKNTNQVNTALFPHGFRPEVKTNIWDVLVITGVRGETKNRWLWNASSSFGTNSNDIHVANSNNASQQFLLGKDAPTSFYLGKLIYKQYINNINFTKELAQNRKNLKTCNLAMGVEWRIENYQQREGDEASWKKYDTTTNIQGGSQPSIGSVNHNNVANKTWTVSGVYIDLEVETKKNLLVGVAGRYEFYDDFGGNLAGKLAIRYKVSEKFSLRSSISNGFRAPSMQQRFFEGTQSFRGSALTSGIFSNNSEVTKAFGIPSLQAERSVNLAAGFISKLSRYISLTVDAYRIQIKNRIVLSGVFRKSNPEVAAMLIDYPDIDLVQFYVNAINTRTLGIDAVLNGNWNIKKIRLGLTLAVNLNRNAIFGEIKTTDKISDISRYTNTLFGIEERTTLEKDQPGEKIILSATVDKGKFGFVLRNTVFGKTATTTIVTNPADTIYESFSSKMLTDLSVSYTPKSWLTITAGANNILDVYPDRLKNYRNTSEGISLYSNGATPFGFNGGYYFVSMSFNF